MQSDFGNLFAQLFVSVSDVRESLYELFDLVFAAHDDFDEVFVCEILQSLLR